MKTTVFLLLTFLSFSLYAQKTYYVSSQGKDSNNGTSTSTPWKTINKLNNTKFVAGDIIKFKRGEVFGDAEWLISQSGTSSKRITITYYGSGSNPVIGNASSTSQVRAINIRGSYVTVDGLTFTGSGNTSQTTALNILGTSTLIKNCIIVGGAAKNKYNTYGIKIGNSASNTVIEKNEIYNVGQGIEVQQCKPCTIKNNYLHDVYATNSVDGDGIRVIGTSSAIFNANYQVVISGNEITKWGENAIDLAMSSNVIVEYNKLHNPMTTLGQYSVGNAIKMGAPTSSQNSSGSIFRYNKIYDLWAPQQPDGDWESNAFSGSFVTSAKIYYNLVYNIYGSAIVRNGKGSTVSGHKWEIYNNTFVTGGSAVQIMANTLTPTYIRNNICKSNVKVSGKSYTYKYPRNSVERDQKWHGTDPFSFTEPYDIRLQNTYSSSMVYAGKNILVKDKAIKKYNSSVKLTEDFSNKYATNPLFKNEGAKDFSLQSGSPAINFGNSVGLSSDLNGNAIIGMPDVNAIEYGTSTASNAGLNIKILLQGPFTHEKMSTASQKLLPMHQPYNTEPWNYSGDEVVEEIPKDVVDWVLLELRDDLSSSSMVDRRAAFVKSDGSVVDLDGTSKIAFNISDNSEYYVVVSHRNHVKVMSSEKVPVNVNENSPLYDFTSSVKKAYGSNAMVLLEKDKWAMFAGDGDHNGIVDAVDYEMVSNHLFESGYLTGDFDLNGVINVLDYGRTNSNISAATRVPY